MNEGGRVKEGLCVKGGGGRDSERGGGRVKGLSEEERAWDGGRKDEVRGCESASEQTSNC